jgi:hypothetical protein
MILKLPASIVSCLVLLISLASSAAAQQKRQTPAKPQTPPAAAPAPTPPPTLDTLLPAGTYRIYGEVRSVGQLIRSNSVNEILEPILKLAGPPKEFQTVIKWLNTHADEVMSSRLILAAWTGTKDLPDTLVAIEFASPEEAVKFQQQLSGFLQKVMSATPNASGEPDKSVTPAPPQPPPYHIQQTGSLILITSTPLNLKKLRPAGSKLLTEDVNFRVARNRLNTESIFVFVDVEAIEKEEEEQRRRAEEVRENLIAHQAAKQQASGKVEVATDPEEPPQPTFVPEKNTEGTAELELGTQAGSQPNLAEMAPPPIYFALGMVLSSLSVTEAQWPAAIGVGVSLEGESFDVRALMVNMPGEKTDPIPFLPVLAAGPSIVPEAPNILPGDTEILVTMSLDLPHIYATMSKPAPPIVAVGRVALPVGQPSEIESPIAALEKQLKIKIRDELLPLLGSEIAVSIPMTGMNWLQPPKPAPKATSQPSMSPSPEPSPDPADSSSDNFTVTELKVNPVVENRWPVLVLSLKDKEGMRALLPKLIESLGFKGASLFAQTERREDTELVSYANVMAYAFIGNFLVISPDVKGTRNVVDSYLKRQTIAGDPHYKNYTRWQPRQVQGQIYLSPSLMESYRKWIQEPTAPVDEQTRAFLTRFSVVAQPVTYSLSNEGFGPLHELHLPKNLVLLLIAATVGSVNSGIPSPDGTSNTAPPIVMPPEPKPPVELQPKLPADPTKRPF